MFQDELKKQLMKRKQKEAGAGAGPGDPIPAENQGPKLDKPPQQNIPQINKPPSNQQPIEKLDFTEVKVKKEDFGSTKDKLESLFNKEEKKVDIPVPQVPTKIVVNAGAPPPPLLNLTLPKLPQANPNPPKPVVANKPRVESKVAPPKSDPAKPQFQPPKVQQKVEPPKMEQPPKVQPKIEPPKMEPPKQEPIKFEPPKIEPPKPEPPKIEPKIEPPKMEAPKIEPPKTEIPKIVPQNIVIVDDSAEKKSEPPKIFEKIEPQKTIDTTAIEESKSNDKKGLLSEEVINLLANAVFPEPPKTIAPKQDKKKKMITVTQVKGNTLSIDETVFFSKIADLRQDMLYYYEKLDDKTHSNNTNKKAIEKKIKELGGRLGGKSFKDSKEESKSSQIESIGTPQFLEKTVGPPPPPPPPLKGVPPPPPLGNLMKSTQPAPGPIIKKEEPEKVANFDKSVYEIARDKLTKKMELKKSEMMFEECILIRDQIKKIDDLYFAIEKASDKEKQELIIGLQKEINILT